MALFLVLLACDILALGFLGYLVSIAVRLIRKDLREGKTTGTVLQNLLRLPYVDFSGAWTWLDRKLTAKPAKKKKGMTSEQICSDIMLSLYLAQMSEPRYTNTDPDSFFF